METGQRHIGRLIKQIDDELRRQVDNEMRPLKMTMSQMRVLVELNHAEGRELTFKQLEQSLGVAQSTMWGLVARLEAKGLVESLGNRQDARAKLVRITGAGTNLCEQSYEMMLAHERQLVAGLTPEEASTLVTLLDRVHASLMQS